MAKVKLTTAQQEWLERELQDWQTGQIISADQASHIRERYESADEVTERQRSIAVQALLGMAAFLFGLAILLLIGFNWDALSRWTKLAVVIAAVSGTHASAFWIRRHTRHHSLSEAVSLLGCILYGAGIWLIAQAFHIQSHYPDGVWWWAIGVLPFALCLDSLLLHVLYVFLLGLWAGLEVFGSFRFSPWWLFGWSDLPNGAFLLPLLAAPGLAWAYRRQSPVAVGLYVPLFAWWTILQAFAMRLDGRSVFWVGIVGAILILFAEAHSPKDQRGIPYRLWGVLLSAGVILLLGSYDFWEHFVLRSNASFTNENLSAALFEIVGTLVLLGSSAAVLLAFRGSDAFNLLGDGNNATHCRRRWFAVLFLCSLLIMSVWSLSLLDTTASLIPIIVANLACLAMALYLVKVGEQEGRTRPFGAGVILFLTWAMARYIDLFAEHGGMLGAAMIFGLCGAGLCVIATFWSRKRRTPTTSSDQITSSTSNTTSTTPAWIVHGIDILARHRARIVIATAVAQIGLLAGMIVVESLPLFVGRRVILRVRPVDPRDLFRGDYVILSYDFNTFHVPGLNSSRSPWNRNLSDIDRTVYVTLEQESDRKHWHGGQAMLTVPDTSPYLKGRVSGDYRQPLYFGIEAWYVQEGSGLDWERLAQNQQLSAEVAIAPWGQAKLVRLLQDL